jgi:hypothetical protein
MSDTTIPQMNADAQNTLTALIERIINPTAGDNVVAMPTRRQPCLRGKAVTPFVLPCIKDQRGRLIERGEPPTCRLRSQWQRAGRDHWLWLTASTSRPRQNTVVVPDVISCSASVPPRLATAVHVYEFQRHLHQWSMSAYSSAFSATFCGRPLPYHLQRRWGLRRIAASSNAAFCPD